MKSFIRKLYIEVYCSKCKARYSNNGEFEPLFKTQAEAIEEIKDYGWEVKKGKAYCENCQK